MYQYQYCCLIYLILHFFFFMYYLQVASPQLMFNNLYLSENHRTTSGLLSLRASHFCWFKWLVYDKWMETRDIWYCLVSLWCSMNSRRKNEISAGLIVYFWHRLFCQWSPKWMWNSAYILANKSPRLNECLLQETNKRLQVAFNQMSFKEKNVQNRLQNFFFFFFLKDTG